MAKRILFTARDYGAAKQLIYVINYFKDKGYDVILLASNPAYDLFKKENLNPEFFAFDTNSSIAFSTTLEATIHEYIEMSKERIKLISPDAIFSGLSGNNWGIDEFALYCSKLLKIPSFQYIDSWQSFNYLKDGFPDINFMVDTEAVFSSYNTAPSPMVIVGSPRHYHYSKIAAHHIRNKMRGQLNLKNNCKLVGYFGQIPDTPGVFDNFKLFVSNTLEISKRNTITFKLLVKWHPGFMGKYQQYENYLNENSIPYEDISTAYDTEDVLCSCDLIAFSYSTLSVDHAFLSAGSDFPIGAILHLNCGTELTNYIKNTYAYIKSPLLKNSVDYTACNTNQLNDLLNQFLKTDLLQETYHKSTKKLLIDHDPVMKIYKVVDHIVKYNNN